MAQKSKAKIGHPFVDDLNPGEEVLWMMSSTRTTIWAELKSIGRIFAAILVMSLLASFVKLGGKKYEIFGGPFAAGSMFALLSLAALPLILNRVVRWWLGVRRPSDHAYIVTNERLISRHKEQGSISLPLEEIPFISLSLSTPTKGLLSFGDDFPMWQDIQNAIYLKHVIETAQQRRLQDNGALSHLIVDESPVYDESRVQLARRSTK